MSELRNSRRKFLASAAAAAGAAALPPLPAPIAASVVEATGQAVAPSIAFSHAGISLNDGQLIGAAYELLDDDAIRVAEDPCPMGESMSFWAAGLGSVFNISTPSIDYDAYVRPDEEDEDDDQLDDFDYLEKYGRERWVEPRHEPAYFDIAPGDPHYAAVLQAMGAAEEMEQRLRARSCADEAFDGGEIDD